MEQELLDKLENCDIDIRETADKIKFISENILNSYEDDITNSPTAMSIEYRNLEGFAFILFDYAVKLVDYSGHLSKISYQMLKQRYSK